MAAAHTEYQAPFPFTGENAAQLLIIEAWAPDGNDSPAAESRLFVGAVFSILSLDTGQASFQ